MIANTLRFSVARVALTALAMAAFQTPAAKAAEISMSDVLDFVNFDVQGSSILIRNPGGLTASLSASSGIESGAAVTLWFVVFNEPEDCISEDPDNPGVTICSGEDVFVDPEPAQVAVIYGTGHVVGNGGQAHFSASLDEGDTSGAVFTNFYPQDQLLDSEAAEIHLVVRTHGPARHDAGIVDQIRTGQFDPAECDQINDCVDVLFSIHGPK